MYLLSKNGGVFQPAMFVYQMGKQAAIFRVQTLLVGGFNPSEKYARQIGFIFPNFRGENKKSLSCHHLASMKPNGRTSRAPSPSGQCWRHWPLAFQKGSCSNHRERNKNRRRCFSVSKKTWEQMSRYLVYLSK